MTLHNALIEEGKTLVQKELTKAAQDVAIELLKNSEAMPSTLRQTVAKRVQLLLRDPSLVKGLENLIEGKVVDFGQKLLQQLSQPAESIGDIEPKTPNLEQVLMGVARLAAQRIVGTQEDQPVEDSEKRRRQLQMSLSYLELSVRTTNCLEDSGVMTIGDLIQQTGEDLLEFRSFGETPLREVKQRLAEKGLKLKGE